MVVGDVLSEGISHGLRAVSRGIASITMLFVTCPKLAMIMVAIIPPMTVGAVTYGDHLKKLTEAVQERLSVSTALAEERLTNVRVVRLFVAEEYEKKVHSRELEEFMRLSDKRSYATAGFYGAIDVSLKLSFLGILGYGGHLVVSDALTMGDLTSFLMYSIYVGGSIAGISQHYSEFMKGVGASSRIFELIERQPHILACESTKVFPITRGCIEFENVDFRYPTRPEVQIFKDFNLKIEPGQICAIVGASGSGKSTVLALLSRFYELDEENCGGRILIDGIDIATIRPQLLRQPMAAVSQEPPLFAASIAENIAYGSIHYSLDDIKKAAQDANAHEFIMDLPYGYDTQVGERGQTLSGGQKQRIAIARALIRDPKILILDEATSALDSENEVLVEEAVERWKQNRSVIIISHHMSSIEAADTIAVIDGGKVAEKGTYEELIQDPDGIFTRLMLQHHNPSE